MQRLFPSMNAYGGTSMFTKQKAFIFVLAGLLVAVLAAFFRITADEENIVLVGEEARAQLAALDESILVWPDENTYVLKTLIIQTDGGYFLSYESVDSRHHLTIQLFPSEEDALRPGEIAIDTSGVPGVTGEIVMQGPVEVRGKPAWRAKEILRIDGEERVYGVLNWFEKGWQITMQVDGEMYDALPALAERLVWSGQDAP
ncbi:hypothetical protein ARMA_2588 [Ardenticatena maritima]|uniref:DUF4367 domain-containing protein n=2 Tax=Ardenticatena maritima TaxID=872965 RepID=A0A0M8K8X3_9CHLR|nr:hypothetical protein ARMA_2588 [Ardenticatena maritima]